MAKTALITGASSGLGEEYAIQLSQEGYDLIINARSEDKLKQLAERLENEYNNNVTVLPADLTKKEDLNKVCKMIKTTEEFDMLVNNAGFGIPKSFMKIPVERHQSMIDLHVTAVVHLSYAALEVLMEKGTGGIITVASMAAFIGSGMYAGTKKFQVDLSKRLAKTVKDTDITIQVLCPGYVRTRFHHTDDYEGIDAEKNTGSWLWLDRDFVIRDSLKNYKKGKLVVVPSIKYKIGKFLSTIGILG